MATANYLTTAADGRWKAAQRSWGSTCPARASRTLLRGSACRAFRAASSLPPILKVLKWPNTFTVGMPPGALIVTPRVTFSPTSISADASTHPRDVLEGGMQVLRGGGGGLGHPSSLGPPMVPAEGEPKTFKLKSSWRRSKTLAVSLKHWKGRRGGGYPRSSYGVRPFKYIPVHTPHPQTPVGVP